MKKKNAKHPVKFKHTLTGKITTFHLIEVVWEDHASRNSNKWEGFDEIKPDIVTCRTVGWKVGENKRAITLAQNIGDNGTVSDRMTILKSCIVAQRTL